MDRNNEGDVMILMMIRNDNINLPEQEADV